MIFDMGGKQVLDSIFDNSRVGYDENKPDDVDSTVSTIIKVIYIIAQ